jgi:glycine/D-amino acid oxidase-like deaminating enzyme
VFQREGGRIVIGRAIPPSPGEFDGHTVKLTNGDSLSGDAIVFAVGPWLGKTFPLMRNRMRTPLGTVVYFATPPGDDRFTHPNLPSWNFPGTTGWAALPVDNRGFRVRGGGGGGGRGGSGGSGAGGAPAAGAGQPQATANQPSAAPAASTNVNDPDLSSRWIEPQRLESPRRFVASRFPALADAPIAQTWACHYESTSSRNFVIDLHPNLPNVWIAGGGNAEAFKQGPVLGEYIARRVLGDDGDPAVARQFLIPESEYAPSPQSGDDDD